MQPADVVQMLKEMQHAGQDSRCPMCETFFLDGHAPDCRLAASVAYMEREVRARQALQAIADAEPRVHPLYDGQTYEETCDRCLELIAMAREGLADVDA